MGREIVPITVTAGQVQFAKGRGDLSGSIMRSVVASGVAICLWDRVKKIGVISNFMYPEPKGRDVKTAMFGTVSIPKAISLMGRNGSKHDDIVAHIVGGARSDDIWDKTGFQNITVARRILQRERINIFSDDTGGRVGRKIVFNVENGTLATVKVMNVRDADWGRES